MASGEQKSIIELRPGDFVQAIDSDGKLISSEIVFLMHKNTTKEGSLIFWLRRFEFFENWFNLAMFLILSDSKNNSISLSSSHLLFTKEAGYVNAVKVKLGDTLRHYSVDKQEFVDLKVTSIRFELKRGYTAPLTNEGTILVNNIDASCYAEINSHTLADWSMFPMKLWYKLTKYFGGKYHVADNVDTDIYTDLLYKFVVNYVPSILK